jgi:hypothetical protein
MGTAAGSATAWNPNATNSVNALAINAAGTIIYAGGVFNGALSIGGQTRNRIAALNNTTGAADVTWDPNANSGVYALAISGSTLYIGGAFTTIGTPAVTRNRIAELDIAGAGLPTDWSPNITNGDVQVIAVSGSTVYAGGGFTNAGTAGGQARSYIAALDATTGLATAWNPSANNSVFTIAVYGSSVYLGGSFTSISSITRNRLAALNASTGVATGWNPNASSTVNALALSGGIIYVGGAFTSIGNGGQTRNRLAALTSLGVATGWNPNVSNGQVNALAVSGSTIYAGGTFNTGTVGGLLRNRIVALNNTTGAVDVAWDPNADNTVSTLAVSGSTIYVGGSIANIGGLARNRIASLCASANCDGMGTAAGSATAWNPNVTTGGSAVNALAINAGGTIIYAGGTFTAAGTIGGQARNRIAALCASANCDGMGTAAGSATAWNPSVTTGGSVVSALAINAGGTIIYAGGSFPVAGTIGGQNRNRIAALDATTGAATVWNPDADNTVSALALSGNMVYVGGAFTQMGSLSGSGISLITQSP